LATAFSYHPTKNHLWLTYPLSDDALLDQLQRAAFGNATPHKFLPQPSIEHIEDASSGWWFVTPDSGPEAPKRIDDPMVHLYGSEIAHVGLYVTEAVRKGIPVKTFTLPMHDVDRAIADGEEEGFVRYTSKKASIRLLVQP